MNEISRTSEKPFCDIVMKGGITSGVVFPLAIAELAKRYTFKNLGGTSAGAIAASIAAAAQHGEAHNGFGLKGLLDLPKFLSGKSNGKGHYGTNLFHFFQPQSGTKPLFKTLTSGLGLTRGSALFCVVLASIREFPLSALCGASPGIFLGVISFASSEGWIVYTKLVFAIILVMLGSAAGAAYQFVQRTKAELKENNFGLCSGMGDDLNKEDLSALTPWLASELDRLSGKDKIREKDSLAGPLTFGDLWGPASEVGGEATREINLEMMTTCLSMGRPYRLPFRQNMDVRESSQFYFSEKDLRQLFPKYVIDWMIQKARQGSKTLEKHPNLMLHALPEPKDMPVVVAVRMSLSFPVLLSAVPLWAVDRTYSDRNTRAPERCWFSDGGISSNFPVHFFDSPLPRWPTFALNLRGPHPERRPVWMPKTGGEGVEEWWTRFDNKGDGLTQLYGFLGAIFSAMHNWADNVQLTMPGCRDRVAHIVLESEEGGLNLNMPDSLIKDLGERGGAAGKLLANRFLGEDSGCKLDWENHRWTRFRATMSALEEMLLKMERTNNELSYIGALKQYGVDDSPSYAWNSKAQFEFACKTMEDLMKLIHDWSAQDRRFAEPIGGDTSPRPRPELRVRPRI